MDQQAYDHIQFPEWHISPQVFSLLYVGSLASRNEPSRCTIGRLMETSDLPRFVDINVRQPWFDRNFADELLTRAEWVKLNSDELSLLTDEPGGDEQRVRQAAEKFRERYQVEQLFITCGAQGAYAVDSRGQVEFADSPRPTPMTDAVGAGDAFAAAMIYGITRDFSLRRTLHSAAHFASRTCSLRGATTNDKAHYALPQPQPSGEDR